MKATPGEARRALLDPSRESLLIVDTMDLLPGNHSGAFVPEGVRAVWTVHNHPDGPLLFSPGDLDMARDMGLLRMDVVFPSRGVVLVANSPDGRWPSRAHEDAPGPGIVHMATHLGIRSKIIPIAEHEIVGFQNR